MLKSNIKWSMEISTNYKWSPDYTNCFPSRKWLLSTGDSMALYPPQNPPFPRIHPQISTSFPTWSWQIYIVTLTTKSASMNFTVDISVNNWFKMEIMGECKDPESCTNKP